MVFALAVFLLLFRYLEMNRFVFLVFLLIGTLLVDIDTRKSKIGGRWWLRPLQWCVSHRGVFHTLVFGLVLSFVIYYFIPVGGMGFALGWFLHLFLDMFTPSGVKLFWPLSRRRISLRLVRSGGWLEDVLFVLLLLVDVGLIIYLVLFSV